MTSPLLYRYSYPLTYLMVVLGLLLLLIQPLTWNFVLPTEFWMRQAWLFSWWMFLFYINMKYLVPKLFFGKKAGWFIVTLLVIVVLTVYLDNMISHWLNLPELIFRAKHPEGVHGGSSKGAAINPFHKKNYINPVVVLATLLVLGISTTIRVIQKWRMDNEIRQDLEKQKINTELSLLKAQINPHFFFNTLNSIYALTHVNVEKSREALHTLSRMMRYVIYDTHAGFISLHKEVEFLKDYIDLMKLRITDNVKVTFEAGTLQDLPVAPMLFLPFVENAFKHGVSGIHHSSIYIGIKQDGKTIKLEVRNTLLPVKRVVLEESSGIGLANTRRRLDLLYPDKYELFIAEKTSENEFKVELTISLS